MRSWPSIIVLLLLAGCEVSKDRPGGAVGSYREGLSLSAPIALQPLPIPLARPALVHHGDWLYAIGGWAVARTTMSAQVYRARILADGTLSPWSATAPLPVASLA